MDIPVVTTERLILRAFRSEDIEGVLALYGDADVARFITPDGKPQGREYAWRVMTTHTGHWMLRGYGMWAVEERAGGALVGLAGPHFPETWPDREVGWAIAKSRWGRGYGTEAARAGLDFAFGRLNWPRAIHVIHPDNVRSIAVAQRLGSAPVGEWNRNGVLLRLYGQDRPAP